MSQNCSVWGRAQKSSHPVIPHPVLKTLCMENSLHRVTIYSSPVITFFPLSKILSISPILPWCLEPVYTNCIRYCPQLSVATIANCVDVQKCFSNMLRTNICVSGFRITELCIVRTHNLTRPIWILRFGIFFLKQ